MNRLRSSAVLVVGLTGLTAELIKNIVLAGIKSLTLVDHRNGDENTLNTIQGTTFLLLPSQRNESTPVSYYHAYTYSCVFSFILQIVQTAKSRIQILNPNVKVIVDNEDVDNKPDEFFTTFNVICVSNASTNTMVCSPIKCSHCTLMGRSKGKAIAYK